MVKMLRIDDRLVHGQVAVLWSKQLGIERIIVANDMAAGNPVQAATLKMAAPAGIKCAVVTVDDAIDILSDPRAKNMRLLAIVNNPHDARRIAEGAPAPELFDVGNYGLIAGAATRTKLADTFYVNEEEARDLAAIVDAGIPSIYQLVPSKAPVELGELLQGLSAAGRK